MRPLLLILAGLCFGSSLAQDTLFFDQNHLPCEPTAATYLRVGEAGTEPYAFAEYHVQGGHLAVKGFYKAPKQLEATGEWTFFWENGEKRFSVSIENGNSSGVSRHWNEAGELIMEQFHVESELEGPVKWWYAGGKLNGEGSYLKGKKDGTWKTWFDNGQVGFVGSFKRGKPIGKMEGWHPDGEKRLAISFDSTGNPYDKAFTWYPNGQVAESWDYTAAKHPTYATFFANGQAKAEGYIDDWGRMCTLQAWDSLGKQAIIKGKGKRELLLEDGELVFSGTWKKGLPSGDSRLLRVKDGQIMFTLSGKMKKGFPKGVWQRNAPAKSPLTFSGNNLLPFFFTYLHPSSPWSETAEIVSLNGKEIAMAIGYPRQARQKRLEGNTLALLWFDQQENISSIWVFSSPHELFRDAVAAHVADYVFLFPPEEDADHAWIPFRFRLQY